MASDCCSFGTSKSGLSVPTAAKSGTLLESANTSSSTSGEPTQANKSAILSTATPLDQVCLHLGAGCLYMHPAGIPSAALLCASCLKKMHYLQAILPSGRRLHACALIIALHGHKYLGSRLSVCLYGRLCITPHLTGWR